MRVTAKCPQLILINHHFLQRCPAKQVESLYGGTRHKHAEILEVWLFHPSDRRECLEPFTRDARFDSPLCISNQKRMPVFLRIWRPHFSGESCHDQIHSKSD